MMFSVFRYGAGVYDYYEGAPSTETHAGRPPIRQHAEIGATPEQAAWIVPSGAKKIGTGVMPRGRIAVLPENSEGLGGISDIASSSVGKLAIVGGLAYWAYKIWGKR